MQFHSIRPTVKVGLIAAVAILVIVLATACTWAQGKTGRVTGAADEDATSAAADKEGAATPPVVQPPEPAPRVEGAETPPPGRETTPPERLTPEGRPPTVEEELPAPATVTAAGIFASLPRFGARIFAKPRFVPTAVEAAEEEEVTKEKLMARAIAGSPLANVPISPDYQLGPADILKVEIWTLDKQRAARPVRVTADGYITISVLGKVVLSGKTLAEAQEIITKRASVFYTDPEVIVELLRQRAIDVYVIGDVQQPGKFTLPGNATLFTALYAAGGPSETGSYRRIRLLRAGKPEREIDIYDYLMYGKREVHELLEAGDTVFVPSLTAEIGVSGAVRRPARYELLEPVSLEQAILMASNFTPNAHAVAVDVWRPDSRATWNLLRVDATQPGPKGSDMKLSDGDLVSVKEILDIAPNTVELRGPVRRPGIYEMTEGLTVGKLLQQAEGVTEGVYIEEGTIWRLNEDFDYETMHFSVRRVLNGEDDMLLQAWDIVKLYAEDLVERPALVSIEGMVRRPGEFHHVERMTVRDLVLRAGDLLPGAYTERAELLRLTADQRRRLLPINLTKAMQDDQQNNMILQRGDILKVLAREDVAVESEVHADGFVRNPGTYARYEDMRISDLIVAASGLRPEFADTIQYTPGRFEGASATRILALTGTTDDFTVEPDLLLKDDDRIGIMGKSEFTVVPKVASILGKIKHPGSYALRLERGGEEQVDTVYDLIQRSGGLLEEANPKGIILYRFKAEVIEKDREENLQYVLNVLNRESGQTLAVAAEGGEAEVMAAAVEQQVGGLLGTDSGALLGVPPRKLGISQWIRAMPIDGARLIATKGKEANLELHHGDVLRVPRTVDFVTVIGCVNKPGALEYAPNLTAWHYLDLAGGTTPDADLKRTLVMRANSAGLPAYRVRVIEAGDVVIVPSQHMFRTETIMEPWTKTLKSLLSVAAAALLF